jgi:hypothetical protein
MQRTSGFSISFMPTSDGLAEVDGEDAEKPDRDRDLTNGQVQI